MTKNQIYRLIMVVVFSPIYLTGFVLIELLRIPFTFWYLTRDIIMIEPQTNETKTT